MARVAKLIIGEHRRTSHSETRVWGCFPLLDIRIVLFYKCVHPNKLHFRRLTFQTHQISTSKLVNVSETFGDTSLFGGWRVRDNRPSSHAILSCVRYHTTKPFSTNLARYLLSDFILNTHFIGMKWMFFVSNFLETIIQKFLLTMESSSSFIYFRH